MDGVKLLGVALFYVQSWGLPLQILKAEIFRPIRMRSEADLIGN